VIGIDSAEMEDEVLENPKFTHIRRRDFEVKKKDFNPLKRDGANAENVGLVLCSENFRND